MPVAFGFEWSDWVGLPWRDRGRTRDGADCWGLCCLVYRDALGIELPSHAEEYRTAADRIETARVLAGEIGDWTDVPAGKEQPFDAMVTTMTGRLHIGLAVRRGLVLHLPAYLTSMIVPFSRFPAPKLYRHKRLM